ncbi:hypothetical protein N9C27_00010 [Luminiphilus sp.]|nr:hypothetical protein [Luminiphilus sp.]
MKKFLKRALIIIAAGFAGLLTFGAILSSQDKEAAEQAGFDSVEEFRLARKENIETKAEYDAFVQRQAEIDAATQGGFLSIDEYKKAQAVNMATKDLYDKYLEEEEEEKAGKARLAALLQSSKYYGLINTSNPYDYDSLIGKSCKSIVNTLKRTKSKSGDFVVTGLFFGIDSENLVSWAATIVEPKIDCERHFGFSCDDWNVNARLNFSISSDTGLGMITENSGGGRTFIDYENAASGYVQTKHYYGEEMKKTLGKSSGEPAKDLLCFEPK